MNGWIILGIIVVLSVILLTWSIMAVAKDADEHWDEHWDELIRQHEEQQKEKDDG